MFFQRGQAIGGAAGAQGFQNTPVGSAQRRADGLILEFVFRKNLPGEARRIGRSSHAHMAVSGARVGDAYAYTASSSGFASGGKDCWQELGFKDDLLGSADYKRYLLSVMF